jgi:hypothetical protein
MDNTAFRDIDKRPGVPKGSGVFMTPSAYMNDETWAKIAPVIADGIRAMPFIKDHPDWWVVMSLDGFSSHVNVDSAHKVFHDRKIFVVKEEGDTSHVNQAYDQSVAKADKASMRTILISCATLLASSPNGCRLG